MPLLDKPKSVVHYDGTYVEWTNEPLVSSEETQVTVEWTNPALLDALRVMFNCKENETIKTLEVKAHGLVAYLMNIDGSDVSSSNAPPAAAKKKKK